MTGVLVAGIAALTIASGDGFGSGGVFSTTASFTSEKVMRRRSSDIKDGLAPQPARPIRPSPASARASVGRRRSEEEWFAVAMDDFSRCGSFIFEFNFDEEPPDILAKKWMNTGDFTRQNSTRLTSQ